MEKLGQGRANHSRQKEQLCKGPEADMHSACWRTGRGPTCSGAE